MSRCNLCAIAVALVLSAIPASGDVILEAGSVVAVRGSTGNTIEVDVRNTGPGSINIGGFNFEITADSDIDFTGAAFSTSAPYIFNGDSFDQATSTPLNSTTGSSLSAGDISNNGNGVILGAGQTAGLGLVTFNVSATAALGPAPVMFSADPFMTNLSDQMGNSILINNLVSGMIDVLPENGVPEPSAGAMLLAALTGLGAWRLIKARL